jgi:hypothetical protein
LSQGSELQLWKSRKKKKEKKKEKKRQKKKKKKEIKRNERQIESKKEIERDGEDRKQYTNPHSQIIRIVFNGTFIRIADCCCGKL